MSERNEEEFEFVESIPLDQLFDKLRKMTGLKNISFESEVRADRFGKPVLRIRSENIVSEIGFLNIIFDEFYIESFSSQLINDNDDPYYWMTIDFTWHSVGGGSNGKTFLDCRYKDGLWSFVDASKY